MLIRIVKGDLMSGAQFGEYIGKTLRWMPLLILPLLATELLAQVPPDTDEILRGVLKHVVEREEARQPFEGPIRFGGPIRFDPRLRVVEWGMFDGKLLPDRVETAPGESRGSARAARITRGLGVDVGSAEEVIMCSDPSRTRCQLHVGLLVELSEPGFQGEFAKVYLRERRPYYDEHRSAAWRETIYGATLLMTLQRADGGWRVTDERLLSQY